MALRRTTENYLKTIYLLSQRKEVRGAYIAEELGISRPTVSVTLKAMEKEGYLTTDEAHVIHLTEQGKAVAQEIYERHVTFQQLLTELGVDSRTAAEGACEMEHAVSPESYEALKQLMIQRAKETKEHDS